MDRPCSAPLLSSTLVALALLGASEGAALAHVSVSSGPAAANTTQEVSFGVGHGCSGADSYRVTIDIPAKVTSVRPLFSDFGKATVQKDMAGAVTSVTWQKPDADLLDADTSYYKLTIRMKTPDEPLTMLYFGVHQTCKDAQGNLTTVDWVGTPASPAPEPAAALTIIPAKSPGWNKWKAPAAIADLAVFLKDAQIVWRGTAAYSSNANTKAQIAATAGVTELTSLAANDEFWVKY